MKAFRICRVFHRHDNQEYRRFNKNREERILKRILIGAMSFSRKSPPAPIVVEKSNVWNNKSAPNQKKTSGNSSGLTSSLKKRTCSYSSQDSSHSSASTFSKTSSKYSSDTPSPIPRRNMNVYTRCGRHTDEFLFGGRSFTDMARSLFRDRKRND